MERKNILIIDDDKLILESLSRVFIKDGWNVNLCSNGQDGLLQMSQNSYDCVLMDVRMPGMSGDQVLQQLSILESEKKIDKQKIIIMTGYADESATTNVFTYGAYSYINKPFDINILLQLASEGRAAKKLVAELEASAASQEVEETTFKKIRKSYEPEDVRKKAALISKELGIPLKHISGCTYNTNAWKGNIENPVGSIQIPLAVTGPVTVQGQNAKGNFYVPFATTEGALVLTYDLGMRLLQMTGPVKTQILSKGVHISPMFPIADKEDQLIRECLNHYYQEIKQVAEGGSRHTKLLKIDQQRIGDNYVLKFLYDTGDAQGLNMINQASYNACKYIQAKTGARFYHRSHYSGIKHYSPLNFKEGQGRKVKASGLVSSKALSMLKVSAVQMKDFFDRCIECASAAGIASVNVHAANAITAVFLACGQDAADISCSHACSTRVEIVDGKDLMIESVLYNLMVATVGGGTGLGTQRECLKIMDCFGGGNADKFAEIVAATVLAGEFPTAAAVITETYVDIHNRYGRNKTKIIDE
jgi:hydroxymethylglutaryl-CoA reductase (NADPH)